MPYPMVLNYSASKAALHSFIISVREQLKQNPGQNINLVELVTPLVQSKSGCSLCRTRHPRIWYTDFSLS